MSDIMETWESLTHGRVYYRVTVDKVRGTFQDRHVEGKGKTFRISQADREDMQMACQYSYVDCFTNGFLKRVDADQNEDPRTVSQAALSDADLEAILKVKQGAAFKKRLEALDKIPFLRIRELAQADGDSVTMTQLKAINEVYEAKYSPNRGLKGPLTPDEQVASFPVMDVHGQVYSPGHPATL